MSYETKSLGSLQNDGPSYIKITCENCGYEFTPTKKEINMYRVYTCPKCGKNHYPAS